MASRVELYEDKHGEWRWRLVADNGAIIADGSEGYASKSNAKRAALRSQELLVDGGN